MADIRVTPQPWLWKPRTKPIRFIEVHATQGNTTPAAQKLAALNWVQSSNNDQGGWGASFSYVIGTDGSMGTVLDDDQMPTYSAGYGGSGSGWAIDEYGISYELAQSAAQEPFTDACLARAAKEIAWKCKRYGIPAVFLTIPDQSGEVPTGLVRHDRCQNGYVLGKTDPGDQFDEAKFLALMGEVEDDGMAIEDRLREAEQRIKDLEEREIPHGKWARGEFLALNQWCDRIQAWLEAHDNIVHTHIGALIAELQARPAGGGVDMKWVEARIRQLIRAAKHTI